MNNILNEDIRALQIMVKEFVSLIKNHSHNYDTTFTSVVSSVNTNGTYVIQDEGGVKRNVKCSIPNITVKVGQNVWVKIPKGIIEDMHICGVK